MVTLYSLKPRFQGLLRPIVIRLAANGVTANQVTLLALLGSLVIGVLVALAGPGPWFLLLPIWLFTRMALNAVDGMLAREHGQASRFGAYLNELSDVLADAALLLPFAVLPDVGPLAAAVVAMFAAISEYAGVMGPLVGASRRYDGPMGKSDRALVLGVLAVLVGIGLPLPFPMAPIFWVVALLLLLTTANRIRSGLAETAGRS